MKAINFFRTAALITLVLIIAVSAWLVSPVILCYAVGGYGDSGSGSGGGLPGGYTYLGENMGQSGVLIRDANATSPDGTCELFLPKGTTVLNRLGARLTSIMIVKAHSVPTAPPDSEIIGDVYDFGPDGSTFDPPIQLTFSYDPKDLPEGVNVEYLVIAYWDGSEWIELEGPFDIDPVNHTISVKISHFTEFSVVAHTAPASFTVSGLTVSPAVANPGSDVTIGITVANTGDLAGSREIVLKIDNEAVSTIEVSLDAHASRTVTFSTGVDFPAGTYEVAVDELIGTLTVEEPAAPAVPPPAPEPTPQPAPSLTPTPAPPPAPVQNPPVQPAPAPTAQPIPEPEPTPVNWWLMVGIIVGVVIILVGIWQFVVRRR